MANSTPQPPAATAQDPVAQTLALIQPWIDYVPQQQRRLGLFICLALSIHLATFFFIRIDTTRAELRHQARTHVTVEYPQAIAVNGQPDVDIWDRMTDPRLFLLPLNPLASLPTEQPPVDLNTNLGTQELPAAAAPEDYRTARAAVSPLEQRVCEAMRPPRQPFTYAEPAPVVADKTAWRWDNALAQREPTGLPDLPSPISDTDLSPTVLRVAVNSDGAVEHVFVEQSSGNLGASVAKDLDQQAVQAAKKIRFKSQDQPGLTWGLITVFWHYAAKPREVVVPTPPTTGQ
jgi:TonB family protein